MEIPTREEVEAFQRDGAVLIRNILSEAQIDNLKTGVAFNFENPGPYASNNEKDGESGLFFDDYCNWTRIPSFEEVIFNSSLAEVAAKLMKSASAQFFHDHVLIKEPASTMATPWHADGPYYFVEGTQTVSFWIPLDPVSKLVSLRCVAGSHRWSKPILPTRWVSEEAFFKNDGDYMDVPDPDADDSDMRVLEWDLQPGDAIAFSFGTMHGARGNPTPNKRRVVSFRFVGDDSHYVERPGPTSPPFPGHGMVSGDKLRKDWFPVLFPRTSTGTDFTSR